MVFWACVVNRPSVAGAVLQSPPSFINSLTDSFNERSLKFKYYLNAFNLKQEELKSLNFGRMVIQHYMSCVMCHG